MNYNKNVCFGFNEKNRQHVTLSTPAMLVIEADMKNYNRDNELRRVHQ